MSGIVQTEKRRDVITTDIYSGDGDRKLIGWLESSHKLTDDTVEVITLHLDEKYKPEKLSGGDMFTKYKDSFDPHTEVLFPNVAIITSGINDLTIMMNGVIQQVTPIKHGGKKFEAIITIDTPSLEPDVFERTKIRIPAGINLHKKIIQIVKYDIFLTIGNSQKLEMLWGSRTITNDDGGNIDESSPVKVVIESGERQVEPLYYKLNGMPATKAQVLYKKGMSSSKITVYFTADSDALVTTCKVDEFTQMNGTFYYSWRGVDTTNIYLDTDKVRLASADTTVVCDIAAEALIVQLREELVTSSQKISEIEMKLTKANNIIASQEEKLKQEELKTEKERISYESTKVTADEKLNQEQHKTKREEISYHSSRDDASSDVVIGSLKVVGAVVGFGTLLFAILKKSPSSSMVEWGLPVFGLTLAKPAILAGIGYTMYKSMTSTAASSVGGVVVSAASSAASAVLTGVSVVAEKICQAASYVAEAVAPAIEKVKEIASSVVSGVVKVCEKVVDVACNVGRSVASTAKKFWDWVW